MAANTWAGTDYQSQIYHDPLQRGPRVAWRDGEAK